MKHHDPARPIGKCGGCCLNLKTSCAAGLPPKDAWSRGRCTRHNDLGVLEQLAAAAPPSGARLAKLRRRQRAALAASEPHYNGVLVHHRLRGSLAGAGGR